MLIEASTGIVKLIDFGTSTKVLEIKTLRRSTVGTPWYTAPVINFISI
jgi:serine/threonine protein kinase